MKSQQKIATISQKVLIAFLSLIILFGCKKKEEEEEEKNPAPFISQVSSTTEDGSYKIGDDITITIRFSESVNVTGTPQLMLETGTTDQTIDYTGGSGSNTLTFAYTVQEGDLNSDLDYTTTDALKLNGGTIKDSEGASASLTLPEPSTTNSLASSKALVIDGVVPTVSSVSSTTTDGTYKIGDSLTFTAVFSENVTVTGTPKLQLETGSTDQYASYTNGSGTTTLSFNYTVQSGDTASDLDYSNSSALELNSGTIKDTAGNDTNLTLSSPGASNSIGFGNNLVIDGIAPTVASVSSETNDGTYKQGDTISITVTFDDNVTVTGGTPRLKLETGSTDQYATYTSGSGTTTHTYTYTIQPGNSASDLDYTDTTALENNSASLTDAAGNNAILTLVTPGSNHSLGNSANLVVDGVAPTVESISSSTNDGRYKIGDTITVTTTFNEAVTVGTTGGTPRVLLETGTTDQYATYVSGSGTNTLSFSYTIQSGDTATDLDYGGIDSFELNGGTIVDSANNGAILTLPTPGTTNSLSANKALIVDGLAPSTSSNAVTAINSDGTYKIGDTITITVTFDESVTVDTAAGTPTLTLETGSIDRVATYSSGSGSDTLTFFYTVQSGDSVSDLDYSAADALTLNNGTIQDEAGNNAKLTLPAPGTSGSLGHNKNLVIDGITPTVASVSSSTNDGTYIIGNSVSITVTFSEAVIVDTTNGLPRIQLETGSTDQYATYGSGSGSTTLTFDYTVQSGDDASDLDYVSTSALEFNNGSIKDSAGNSATLTLATPSASNSLASNKALVIDGVTPTISSVSSSTSDGTYTESSTITVLVTFSEAVTVNTTNGTPQIKLETGATDRYAIYSGGSGTDTLTFNYTVQSGDNASDLDYHNTSALELNNGTIKDGNGNNTSLTLATPGETNSLAANKALVIDGISPAITAVSSGNSDGSYKVGDTLTITVTFDDNVAVTGTPRIQLETGSTDQYATYTAGSETTTLSFKYTVQNGDTASDLDYTGTTALELNSGSIKDSNGNSATLTLAKPGETSSLGNNKAIVIDGVAPGVSTNAVNSTTADGTYILGDTISISITFSEDVTVDTTGGTPTLKLETGSTDRTAGYVSGSGSSTLLFSYTVQSGDATTDLDYSATNALTLNGGTIQDTVGNEATLTLPLPGTAGSLGANKALVIDGTVPTVTGVSSSTADGSYKSGETIAITVAFSESVTVDTTNGTPRIQLETGTADQYATYVDGSGGTTLTFNYAIQSGDTANDLDYVNTGSLELNNGTIKDSAGNNATLTLASPGAANSLGANKGLVVDGVLPAVSTVSSSNNDGNYGTGSTIAIIITFSEVVTVDTTGGTPRIQLETGTNSRYATYSDGSGNTTLTFNYTVQTGDIASDLDYTTTTSLELNGGTIKDSAGNSATLTLPSPGATNSLGANKAIVVDGNDSTAPTPGNSGTITLSSVSSTGLTLNWSAATDSVTAQANLQYAVYYDSTADNLNTVAAAEGRTQAMDYTANTTQKAITGMSAEETRYFVVIVKDEAGNKALYTAKSGTTNTPKLFLFQLATSGSSGVHNGNWGNTSAEARSNVDASCDAKFNAYSNISDQLKGDGTLEIHGFIGFQSGDAISDFPTKYSMPTDLPVYTAPDTGNGIQMATDWSDWSDGTSVSLYSGGLLNYGGVSSVWWGHASDAAGTLSSTTCNGGTSADGGVTGHILQNGNWYSQQGALACNLAINTLCIAYRR